MSDTMAEEWQHDFGDCQHCDDRISSTLSGEYDYFRKEEKFPRYLSVIFTTWVLSSRSMRKMIDVNCTEKDVDVQMRVTCGDWPDRINGVGLYFTNATFKEFISKPAVMELAADLEKFIGTDQVKAYLASKEDIKWVRNREPKSANQYSHNTGRDPLGAEMTNDRNKKEATGTKRKRMSDGNNNTNSKNY